MFVSWLKTQLDKILEFKVCQEVSGLSDETNITYCGFRYERITGFQTYSIKKSSLKIHLVIV